METNTQSSNDEGVAADSSNTGTSSMTLPERANGWETSSTDDTFPSSKTSSHDELIGSPYTANTSNTQSDNADFDQNTVISFNENDDTLEDDNAPNNPLSSQPLNVVTDSTLPRERTRTESASCSEVSDYGSETMSVDSKAELSHLKRTVKNLKKELEAEKDAVIQLRRKVIQTSRDKLGQTSQFNDEMSLLKYENVALQARLEEQTVHTEQLEYELTKSRKKHKQDQSYSAQRELQDTTQLEELNNRLTEAKAKLAELEEKYTTVKQEKAEEIHKLTVELESTNSKITGSEAAIEITRVENSKLTDYIKQQECTLKEMLEKMQTTENELSSTSADLRKATDELSGQRSLTEQQAALLQEVQDKHKTLSGELEEERSLSNTNQCAIESLETRSVQLECALNDEKSISGDLRYSSEQMRRQFHELEDKHGKQSRELSEAVHSLSRLEQETSNLKKQLSMEKEDKRDLVNKLKKQLDVHQEHVNKLRAELAVTNRHQKYMEQISQKIVNDLQPVFNGFPTETREVTTDISSSSLKSASEDRTRNVFDTLHNSVSRYKKRITTLADEKMKAKSLCDSLTKESASYKEMLYEKEKAYDDCKTKLTDAVREMDRVSRESTELAARCATMTVDIETAKSHNETLQAQCQSLNHEIIQIRGRYERELDEKHLYLQHISHLLTADLDLTSTLQGQVGITQDKLTWHELSTTVSERLSTLISEVVHLRGKVTRLDETVSKSESFIERLREDHSSKLNDVNYELSATIERSSQQWREERARLEEHYNNMLNENQNRQQKSKRNAEEAWDRLRDSDEANRTLESEKLDVHEKITLLEQRQRSLICALALITGAYFPLLNKSRQLREQRSMLMQQCNRFDVFKTQVSNLLQTLAVEIPISPVSTPRGSAYSRLRFRRVVLVVLAAHRLRKACGKRSSICIRDDERRNSFLCWTTSDCNVSRSEMTRGLGEGDLIQWLCHTDLESVANIGTKEILEAFDRLQGGDSGQQEYLKSVVSSCLSKMIRQLSALYKMDDMTMRTTHTNSYITSNLSIQLLNGLHSSMSRVRPEDHLEVTPAQTVVTRLQERVLNFIQQLHTSESERKRLRQTVQSLNQSMDDLRQYQEACSSLETELHGARKQMEELVPVVKLEDVMSQLDGALEREKHSQSLLSDQNLQLKELSRRLENEASDRNHTEQSARFALKTLQDELESKETVLNNLSRQASVLKGEKQSLLDNIYDADHALKTAANDRQTLSNYIETLTTAFSRCAADGGNADLSRVMLSGELIPSGRPTPDLLAVQKLAHEFVEAYTALQAKISALKIVTTEQLHEITRLKQEMSLVCTGQRNYIQLNNNQVYEYPSSGYGSSLSPLKVTGDHHSSIKHSPAVPDMGLVTRTAPHQSPLKSYLATHQYPVLASPSRPIHNSPRLSSSRGSPSPRLEMNGNIRR